MSSNVDVRSQESVFLLSKLEAVSDNIIKFVVKQYISKGSQQISQNRVYTEYYRRIFKDT